MVYNLKRNEPMAKPLILASTSAYKKKLLQRLNIGFTCASPCTNEEPLSNEQPHLLAMRLAQEKALEVAKLHPETIIIGSDQVGDHNGSILNKPGDFDQAFTQLSAQSGQTVYFHSAVSVVLAQRDCQIKKDTRVNTTKVVFNDLTSQQIEDYLNIEQPFDCAGSFKSEGLGISLFSSIESNDPTSLIGLPLIELCNILKNYDVKIPHIMD
jgi:septum formation protein